MARGSRRNSLNAKNGGLAVMDKYGPEFYREIGRKGGQALKDKGIDFAKLGKAGGTVTKERHGTKHFSEIGRKGGQNGKGNRKPRINRGRPAPAVA